MIRPTGARRSPPRHLNALVAAGTPVFAKYTSPAPAEFCAFVMRYHDQPRFPDCVGEATASMVEGARPDWGPISGVRLWTDARRRDARLHAIDEGTYPTLAFESLRSLGPVSYRPGEETEDNYARRIETWQEGQEAWARRQKEVWLDHYALDPADSETPEMLRRLLAAGWQASISTGTTTLYQRRGAQDALDPAGVDELGGDDGGHNQRVIGWASNGWWLIQNSWGSGWGGAIFRDRILYGAAPVLPEVLAAAWEIHAIRVR